MPRPQDKKNSMEEYLSKPNPNSAPQNLPGGGKQLAGTSGQLTRHEQVTNPSASKPEPGKRGS